jgi:HlyD family secretion protein
MKNIFPLFLIFGFLLTSCGPKTAEAVTPVPTINLDSSSTGASTDSTGVTSSSSFTASGTLKPIHEAELGFLSSNYVSDVLVNIGDKVESGKILAKIGGREQAQAAVSGAELQVQAAQEELDKVQREAPEISAQAQTDLIAKGEDLKDAKDKVKYLKHLDWLRSQGKKPETVSVSKQGYNYPTAADMAKAEAELTLSQAIYDAAALHLDDVKNGPEPALLKAAEAKLQAAKDEKTAAEAKLAELDIKAPFNGVVSAIEISAGDLVTPGEVLFIITDDSGLYVETTDLSERDAPSVTNGQTVTVWIKALSQEVPGKVKVISPRADSIGGDVVYQVIVTLDEIPEGALPGMSVEVRFK